MVEAGHQNVGSRYDCGKQAIYDCIKVAQLFVHLHTHSGALPQPFHTNSSIFLYHLRAYISYIPQHFAQFLMLWLACHQAIFVFLPQLHNEPSPSSAVPFITILVVQNNPTIYIWELIYIWGVVESPDKSVAWPAPPCSSSIFPDQSSAETMQL